MRYPAAPSTASSSGEPRECPDCGDLVGTMYGMMGTGEPLRCAGCYDDWFYRDSEPGVREAAEAHLNQVLTWLTGFGGDQ